MKILDRYIIIEYLTRLVSVFGICMLIFVIQTFWLFFDELAGKGLDILIISKFLIYYLPKLFPLILPLSILLASLMTFGSLAENYEFAAIKSSGISLIRCITPLFILHIFIGIGCYYFANNVLPSAEVKSFNLRRNLAKLKPAIAIREGVFNDLGRMNIRVNRKHGEDDRLLEDVIIHEKTSDNKNRIVIKASRGELRSKTTDANLQLVLFDGNRYEEVLSNKPIEKLRYHHTKTHFEEYIMNIDLSEFNDVDLNKQSYTSTYRMQKINQLEESIDSLEKQYEEKKNIFSENFLKKNFLNKLSLLDKDSFKIDSILNFNVLNFVKDDMKWRKLRSVEFAINSVGESIRNLEDKKRTFFLYQKLLNLHKITLHEKYTIIFACILLFLIGAPLGSIIRKGGLGLPLVLSIIIFLSYHYVGIFAKNAAEDNSISPLIASWFSTIILSPFAYILTKRASSDKGSINLDFITLPFNWLYNKLTGQISKSHD